MPTSTTTAYPDGYERSHSFGPSNADEHLNRSPDGGDDWDDDGVCNTSKADAGIDPDDPNGSSAGGWLSVTGDHPGDQPKTTSRTYTIKKGDSRLLVVGTSSVSLLVANQKGEVANLNGKMELLLNANFQKLTEESRTEHLDYCDSVYVDPS